MRMVVPQQLMLITFQVGTCICVVEMCQIHFIRYFKEYCEYVIILCQGVRVWLEVVIPGFVLILDFSLHTKVSHVLIYQGHLKFK